MSTESANLEMDHADDAAKLQRRLMFKQRIGVVLILAIILIGCVVVYFHQPNEESFYPRCTLHQMTGLHCPGCGGTRMMYALLHGDLLQAAAYNLYLLIALPFLMWWGGYGVWATFKGKMFNPPRFRPWLYSFMWISMLAFAILRNVNVWPFNLLAPHELYTSP
jgi:hypothetical protein